MCLDCGEYWRFVMDLVLEFRWASFGPSKKAHVRKLNFNK